MRQFKNTLNNRGRPSIYLAEDQVSFWLVFSKMTINVTKKWSDDMVYKFNVTNEASLQKAMQFIRDNQSHYTNNAQIECFWVRER
jgi:hypothetical protein